MVCNLVIILGACPRQEKCIYGRVICAGAGLSAITPRRCAGYGVAAPIPHAGNVYEKKFQDCCRYPFLASTAHTCSL